MMKTIFFPFQLQKHFKSAAQQPWPTRLVSSLNWRLIGVSDLTRCGHVISYLSDILTLRVCVPVQTLHQPQRTNSPLLLSDLVKDLKPKPDLTLTSSTDFVLNIWRLSLNVSSGTCGPPYSNSEGQPDLSKYDSGSILQKHNTLYFTVFLSDLNSDFKTLGLASDFFSDSTKIESSWEHFHLSVKWINCNVKPISDCAFTPPRVSQEPQVTSAFNCFTITVPVSIRPSPWQYWKDTYYKVIWAFIGLGSVWAFSLSPHSVWPGAKSVSDAQEL